MTKKLRKYLRKLKKDFPLRKPVRIRTCDSLVNFEGDRIYGSFEDKSDYYLIWIGRQKDDSMMVDTLFHEWAHGLLWPKCSVRHTNLFWQTYGSIYRHYLD